MEHSLRLIENYQIYLCCRTLVTLVEGCVRKVVPFFEGQLRSPASGNLALGEEDKTEVHGDCNPITLLIYYFHDKISVVVCLGVSTIKERTLKPALQVRSHSDVARIQQAVQNEVALKPALAGAKLPLQVFIVFKTLIGITLVDQSLSILPMRLMTKVMFYSKF